MPVEETSEFVRLMRALPERERGILVARLFMGASLEELATLHGLEVSELEEIESAARERVGLT